MAGSSGPSLAPSLIPTIRSGTKSTVLSIQDAERRIASYDPLRCNSPPTVRLSTIGTEYSTPYAVLYQQTVRSSVSTFPDHTSIRPASLHWSHVSTFAGRLPGWPLFRTMQWVTRYQARFSSNAACRSSHMPPCLISRGNPPAVASLMN